jgi:hypothetical protein
MTSRGGLEVGWRLARRAAAAAAAALLLAATSAAAGPPAPASPAPSPERDVVVTGQAPKAVRERQLQAFVKRAPALNNGEALARWVRPVCPVVAGMTEDQGEYVLMRLFQVARAAGAPVIEDGRCTANVYIIATADPDALIKAWARRSPAIFAGAQAAEVRKFEQTPRPVRTWYNARLDRLTTDAESPFEGLELARNLPVIHHAADTRLQSNSPYALSSAIIVIDSARLAGTKVGALADYLALAALVQLRAEADGGGAPSILSLFAPPAGSPPPDGLTAWDTAFLHALYHTSLEDLHQASTIAVRMDEELGRGSAR